MLGLLIQLSLLSILCASQSYRTAPDGTYDGVSGTDSGDAKCGDIIYGTTSTSSYTDYYRLNINDDEFDTIEFTLCGDENNVTTDFDSGLSLWKYNGSYYIYSYDDNLACNLNAQIIEYYYDFDTSVDSYYLVVGGSSNNVGNYELSIICSSNIYCSSYFACYHENIICRSGVPCYVYCNHLQACRHATINGNGASKLVVIGSGPSALLNAKIYGTDSGNTSVYCGNGDYAPYVCEGIEIYGAETQRLYVECDSNGDCFGSSYFDDESYIYCPPQYNGETLCDFECKSGSDCTKYLTIATDTGYGSDVDVMCDNSDSEHCDKIKVTWADGNEFCGMHFENSMWQCIKPPNCTYDASLHRSDMTCTGNCDQCEFYCNNGDICQNILITCQSDTPCYVDCTSDYVCSNAIINGNGASNLTVIGTNPSALANVRIYGTDNGDTSVYCGNGAYASNVCRNIEIYGAETQRLYVECDNGEYCFGSWSGYESYIYCPSQYNGESLCTFKCKSDTNCSNHLTIVTDTGYDSDVNVICDNSDFVHCDNIKVTWADGSEFCGMHFGNSTWQCIKPPNCTYDGILYRSDMTCTGNCDQCDFYCNSQFCQYKSMTCQSGIPCYVYCTGYYVCSNATINGNDASNLTVIGTNNNALEFSTIQASGITKIECKGFKSCYFINIYGDHSQQLTVIGAHLYTLEDANIHATDSGNTNVYCRNASFACRRIEIYGAETQRLYVECNTNSECFSPFYDSIKSYIYCPSQDNNETLCTFECKNGSDCSDHLTIVTETGYDSDVDVICDNSDSEHCNNIEVTCSETAESCIMDYVDSEWTCVGVTKCRKALDPTPNPTFSQTSTSSMKSKTEGLVLLYVLGVFAVALLQSLF